MRINQKLMKALKFIGAAAAFAIIVPFVGAKASAATFEAFEVTGGTLNTDYTYASGVLTIKSNKEITIANKYSSKSTIDRIEVAKDVSANITLAGVDIDVSAQDDSAAFKIADDSIGNVTITLANNSKNVLKSGKYCAGLQKSRSTGPLVIKGTGSLEATGGKYAAGIGGGYEKNSENITISGGTVTATGGDYGGAGIGGGGNGSGSNIIITGGTVIAKGQGGAGIGGGGGVGRGKVGGNGSNIKITGGTVTAQGGDYAAGIGGGWKGSGNNIIINGGSVKVTAGDGANAIGGGKGKGTVTPKNIDNKEVYLLELDKANNSLKVDGQEYPTDHGDGKVYVYLTEGKHTIETESVKKTVMLVKDSSSKLGEIGTAFTITATNSGETLVYGTDYTYPAKTGVLTIMSAKAITIANADPQTSTTDTIVVEKPTGANITLAGVNINVSSGSAFKIADDSTGNVTITLADNSKNVLKSGQRCAGLQKNSTDGSLEIKGTGSLEATGGDIAGMSGGAGIGGGNGKIGSNITISGGEIIATGSGEGAGIGGGGAGSGSNITISGGKVIAKGGDYAAGIGGGSMYHGENIIISGGTVIATGGSNGAGIGGGLSGNGSDITITGGTVTATGVAGGAGIGGGNGGEGKNITISGGSVKATAGFEANAIGGGKGKVAVTPTNGTDPVYLCEIKNPNGDPIKIDNTTWKPVNHAAVNPNDTTLYAYLTGKDHTVTVGSTKNNCIFDNTTNTFKLTAVTTPSKPSGGNNRPTKPEITDYPIIDGKETTWKNIAKVISELEEGEEIEITLNGSTTVPADVIKAIKDSKAVAKIKITSAFSRTIDGSKLTDSDIMDYDFDIDLVTAKGTETLRGTVGTGFAIDDITDKAVLNIIFKSNHAGKFANLYKKVGEKLVFIDNAKIGSDGSVSGLVVYEKGEYVVMLGTLSDRAGDMNSDGILNAKDALAVLRHAAMIENGINPDVADMDGDKVITAKDALIILRKSAGLAG